MPVALNSQGLLKAFLQRLLYLSHGEFSHLCGDVFTRNVRVRIDRFWKASLDGRIFNKGSISDDGRGRIGQGRIFSHDGHGRGNALRKAPSAETARSNTSD